MIFIVIHSLYIGYCAEANEQICDTLGQIEMVEKTLNKVLFGNDIGEELFWALDQPEGKNLVQIATKSWIEVADLLLHMRIGLIVEGD